MDTMSDIEHSEAEFIDVEGDEENPVPFRLFSPLGGARRYIEFVMTPGKDQSTVVDELKMHLENIFKLGLGIKKDFEKSMMSEWEKLPWADEDRCPGLVRSLNKCIVHVVEQWEGLIRPPSGSQWFQSPFLTPAQCVKLSSTVFNRVVNSPRLLRAGFTSLLSHGEPGFEQLKMILDRLQLTDRDVLVNLQSGIGHVVTYASAITKAKRCVGIEIRDATAMTATMMKTEFEKMMAFYGKKYRPLDIIHGEFTAAEHHNLITEEATVLFVNNLAFDPLSDHALMKFITEKYDGDRVVCTKELQEIDNVVTLECEELQMPDAPLSWSHGVRYFLYTINSPKKRDPPSDEDVDVKDEDEVPAIPTPINLTSDDDDDTRSGTRSPSREPVAKRGRRGPGLGAGPARPARSLTFTLPTDNDSSPDGDVAPPRRRPGRPPSSATPSKKQPVTPKKGATGPKTPKKTAGAAPRTPKKMPTAARTPKKAASVADTASSSGSQKATGVAAAVVDDKDKLAISPDWVVEREGRTAHGGRFADVYAPDFSIFEEDLSNLPPRRKSSSSFKQ